MGRHHHSFIYLSSSGILMDSRERGIRAAQFPRGGKWLPSPTFPNLLSPSEGIAMGYGAEAINPERAFRHLIWKLLAPFCSAFRDVGYFS